MIGISKAEERECGTENNILRNNGHGEAIENSMAVLQKFSNRITI